MGAWQDDQPQLRASFTRPEREIATKVAVDMCTCEGRKSRHPRKILDITGI
jgi:hypothetical protein